MVSLRSVFLFQLNLCKAERLCLKHTYLLMQPALIKADTWECSTKDFIIFKHSEKILKKKEMNDLAILETISLKNFKDSF